MGKSRSRTPPSQVTNYRPPAAAAGLGSSPPATGGGQLGSPMAAAPPPVNAAPGNLTNALPRVGGMPFGGGVNNALPPAGGGQTVGGLVSGLTNMLPPGVMNAQTSPGVSAVTQALMQMFGQRRQ